MLLGANLGRALVAIAQTFSLFRGECDGGLYEFPCCLSTFHVCITTSTVFVLMLMLVLLTTLHGSPAKVPPPRMRGKEDEGVRGGGCVCAHPVLHACDLRLTPTPLLTRAHTAAPRIVLPLRQWVALLDTFRAALLPPRPSPPVKRRPRPKRATPPRVYFTPVCPCLEAPCAGSLLH